MHSTTWWGGRRRIAAALTTVSLAAGVTAVAGTAVADQPDDRQAEFSAAAETYGVPEEVLLAVSYMQSRWQDHGGEHSTSGGFGPMHLTDVEYVTAGREGHHHDGEDARGDQRRPMTPEGEAPDAPLDEDALQTIDAAAALTGHAVETLRTDSAANIEGGAALLAEMQTVFGASDDPADWYGAVVGYSQAGDTGSAAAFADEVFELINSGAVARTDDGVVELAATAVTPAVEQLSEAGLRESGRERTDCPRRLGCEWIPAPYEQYGETDGDYGNHDIADRPNDIDIDYIVIHDTEGSYETTLGLVQDPTYVSWQYTLRSVDGHIAQHVRPSDVAWQAGNWSVNMRSIGLEHEGYAADGSWYTEALYRSSAKLVKYLANRFDIPLDRDHIIGHDNVPGIAPANIPGMHWDPGPYWDWAHYFDLMGAPFEADRKASNLVMVAPEFETNRPEMIGCDGNAPAEPCPERPSSTVFLYSEPDVESDLLLDVGLHPGSGGESTNRVSDLGSRAATGQVYVVAEQRRHWTAVWYLGQKGWIHNPAHSPTLKPVSGQWVEAGSDDVPVYGVAYPEDAAYEGTEVPVQEITALPYTIDRGERYSFGFELTSQYYWAKVFDESGIVISGDRVYYQIQLGNRIAYVDADDVRLRGRP